MRRKVDSTEEMILPISKGLKCYQTIFTAHPHPVPTTSTYTHVNDVVDTEKPEKTDTPTTNNIINKPG